MQAESRLRAYRELADRRLGELLPSEHQEPAELHAAMRYSCLAPGKRLRPALCLASAEAVATREPKPGVLDASCALEMVHCFSLIHDDLPAIDDDDLRRGMPTCHVKFGEGLALLAGDALFALSFEVLSNVDASPERVVRAIRILARATGSDGLVGGEVADILSEGKSYDAPTLRLIHARKTGALISAACEIGAILGGGDDAQVAVLREFGEEVGLAFQIIDDVLNETSTPERLGKATGSDRSKSKATYPGLFGVDESKSAAETRLSRAQELLAPFPQPSARALAALAEFSVERLH